MWTWERTRGPGTDYAMDFAMDFAWRPASRYQVFYCKMQAKSIAV